MTETPPPKSRRKILARAGLSLAYVIVAAAIDAVLSPEFPVASGISDGVTIAVIVAVLRAAEVKIGLKKAKLR